jgi:hypothetical protein
MEISIPVVFLRFGVLELLEVLLEELLQLEVLVLAIFEPTTVDQWGLFTVASCSRVSSSAESTFSFLTF